MNGAEMAFMVMVHVHTSFVVIICAALWFRAFIQILINNQSKAMFQKDQGRETECI